MWNIQLLGGLAARSSERVVTRFRDAGYTFVTVAELLRRVPVDQLNRPAQHALVGRN